ncbi:MAG: hypothetical protein ACK476_06650 [Fluviicola sp.]
MLCQEKVTRDYRFTFGASFQYDFYFYEEITSSNHSYDWNYEKTHDSGYTIELRSNFQNRFIMLGAEFGFNYSPIDNYTMVLQPELKGAFNLNFKEKNLNTFIGPFASLGYLLPIDRSNLYTLKNSLTFSTGIIFSKKFFQIEIGTLFRNKFNYEPFPQYKSCFYLSIGFRLPLKKEPKN